MGAPYFLISLWNVKATAPSDHLGLKHEKVVSIVRGHCAFFWAEKVWIEQISCSFYAAGQVVGGLGLPGPDLSVVTMVCREFCLRMAVQPVGSGIWPFHICAQLPWAMWNLSMFRTSVWIAISSKPALFAFNTFDSNSVNFIFPHLETLPYQECP